jgi:hypothetical protein
VIIGWAIQILLAISNIGIVISIILLKNEVVPVAQADLELFLLIIVVGGISILASGIALVVKNLLKLASQEQRSSSFFITPFSALCLINIGFPFLAFLLLMM